MPRTILRSYFRRSTSSAADPARSQLCHAPLPLKESSAFALLPDGFSSTVFRVLLSRSISLVLVVSRVRLVLRVRRVRPELMALTALRDHRVSPDLRGRRVPTAPRVLRVTREIRATLGTPDLKAHKAYRATREP